MRLTELEKIINNNKERYLKEFFQNDQISDNISDKFFDFFVSQSDKDLDDLQRNHLRKFSKGKVRELTNELRTIKNQVKNEKEFVKASKHVFDKHLNYSRVEGLNVKKGSQQMIQWNSIVDKMNEYNIEWITVGDSKVRDEHQRFNGLVLNAKHDFWKSQFPGRDYNCRCTHKLVKKKESNIAPSNVKSPAEKGISVNPGMTGVFFNDNHTYMKRI